MNPLMLLALSVLVFGVSADIRCNSCDKVPVLGCLHWKSCLLQSGHQCLTTNVYLGKMWLYSKLRCGTPEEPCLTAVNKTDRTLGLNYNTTCCGSDSCNNAAPPLRQPLPLAWLAAVGALGFWLFH
ncbi:lymphocyte antigen 6 complex locus protein G6c [Ornithorhynchus anatinus]|uniref:lymphocyte antigen 6 complex locus protein G6c n=1 Tax=Ornithorhynchus anatinus TaxID=9258 RepID=UPI0010A870C5|nr:lymphocyte antigen 6 complex locus protein G6c [Ornithorhynchus anatinus]